LNRRGFTRRAIGLALSIALGAMAFSSQRVLGAGKPNVLFIAVDDLNHWVGHLNRNPQTITPNLDRLASWGVSFANAYCAAPACNPSRTALMSGMRPATTGIYHNPDDYRPHIRPEQTLNSHFRANGYRVTGAGKIYHGGGGRRSEWDDYAKPTGDRRVEVLEREAVGALKWAMLEGGDDVLNDFHTVSYCIDELNRKHDRPFFIACGIFRPHLPWNVPKKYFDLQPLESIELPPHDPDDLSDVPPTGRRMARPGGDHKSVLEAGAWKRLVRGYLASISYADAQLGRLLDAIETSPLRDNTIIVLWGDHGWHLGEKSHWRKFALWEEATRAPLIWVVPGLTPQGEISQRTVDFMSIYPTLCDLAGLPVPEHVEGISLRPLLRDPAAPWDRPALTTHGFQNHALRSEDWRLIRYADGSEELYDEQADPFERTNLADDPKHEELKARLKKWFPTTNKPQVANRSPANPGAANADPTDSEQPPNGNLRIAN
jgi:arylsulfatase A-like enzyme